MPHQSATTQGEFALSALLTHPLDAESRRLYRAARLAAAEADRRMALGDANAEAYYVARAKHFLALVAARKVA